MGRLLAIDYGKKRTGIAVSDYLKLIAGGLMTIDTPHLLDFIADYLQKEDVERIIVGYPKQMNGEESENMKRISPFVNRLKKLYPSIPVELYDERFTSVIAQRAVIDGGVKKKNRRENKGLIDMVSATIILEDFMASKQNFTN